LTDAETLGVAIGLDVNGFLTKPFKPVTVIRTIMQALSEEEIEIRSKSEYLAITTDLELPRVNSGLGGSAMGLGTESKRKGVSIHKLRPGMQLARDVISKTGQLLLSAGFILNERTIPRLHELKDLIADDGYYVEP
jgi:hypothetical protein